MSKYFINRGIKKRSDLFNVNQAAAHGINYRLVEVCFIDNDDDLNTFRQNIDSISKGLVEAITGQKISILANLNQGATVVTIERGGAKTPDTYPNQYAELVEGNIVEVRQQATHYYDGKEINPRVNGQRYVVTGKMNVDKSHSKRAYRLSKDGAHIGWVLEQDIVEAWTKPQEPRKEQNIAEEDREFTINGKRYEIKEK